MSRRAALIVIAARLLTASAEARAEPDPACGAAGRPWVEVVGQDEIPEKLTTFVGLLGAELSARGIALCTSRADAASPPLATVRVKAGSDQVALTVEVHDAITSKQVSREVALTGLPGDSQPLAVALAADELLRASWAELALRTAPPPALPVPVEVTRTVREALAAPPAAAPARVHLGVGLVWEKYGRGVSLYGADGSLGVGWSRRFRTALQFGLRTGPTAEATDGGVQPSAWSLGLAAGYTFTPVEGRWGLDGVVLVDVERLTFVPAPASGATGAEQSAFALLSGLGPRAWFAALPSLRVGVEVLATAVLRGVDAADAGQVFVGVGGIGWLTELGVSSAL